MNRRSFIGSILALSAAPAIVRADSLMRIVPRDRWITFSVTFDGATSRLVVPAAIVFDVAHDDATRQRVLDFMTGVLAKLPPEAGIPRFVAYEQIVKCAPSTLVSKGAGFSSYTTNDRLWTPQP